jgi:hypothetical protein
MLAIVFSSAGKEEEASKHHRVCSSRAFRMEAASSTSDTRVSHAVTSLPVSIGVLVRVRPTGGARRRARGNAGRALFSVRPEVSGRGLGDRGEKAAWDLGVATDGARQRWRPTDGPSRHVGHSVTPRCIPRGRCSLKPNRWIQQSDC